MAISLCSAFRQLGLTNCYSTALRCMSTNGLKSQKTILRSTVDASTPAFYNFCYEPKITFAPKSLNIDIGLPKQKGVITSIVDNPYTRIPIIDEIPKIISNYRIVPESKQPLSLPPSEQIIEKFAVRLIVIRRKKMKKHKRRKVEKKMKFLWRKIKQRREQLKEKAFLSELTQQMKDAEAFDAKEYVSERLEILTRQKKDIVWRGEILPEAMVKQFREEKRLKKEAKRNKPRLTLD